MSVIKKNITANFVGSVWQAIMGLAFVPIYIRYLGVESYGLIGIFALLQGWLALLDMGMTPTLTREMARFTGGAHDSQSIRDLLRTIEIISGIIAVAIVIVVWAASNWLASDWLRVEKLPVNLVAQAFTIMGVVTALRFIENIYRSSIVGLQRQVLFNVVAIIMSTLRGVGSIGILIWISPTIGAFFIWQGLLSIATVAVFAVVLYHALPAVKSAHFSISALKNIWYFAAGMMAISFLAPILTQIDKIILSRMLTLEVFGYYALAATVVNALYVFPQPITAAFFPRFTELFALSDMAALKAAYHKGAQTVTVLMGTAAIILIVFGDMVIMLWTANPGLTNNITMLVMVLSIGTLLNGLVWIPYQMQLACGWTSLAVKATIVTIIVIIPAILLVVPKYGAIGAAWTWVGLTACHGAIIIYFMHRRLLQSEKWHWLLQDVMIPLVAGFGAAVLFRHAMPTFHNRAAQMVALLLSSCAVLLASAMSASTVRKRFLSYIPKKFKLLDAESV